MKTYCTILSDGRTSLRYYAFKDKYGNYGLRAVDGFYFLLDVEIPHNIHLMYLNESGLEFEINLN